MYQTDVGVFRDDEVMHKSIRYSAYLMNILEYILYALKINF